MEKAKRIVVLGAGFGGLVTAIRLAKKIGRKGEVVLVDRRDHHLYTPWLYDVATSFLLNAKPAQLKTLERISTISLKDIVKFNGYKNLRFRQAEVESVDAETKHVVFSDGHTLTYDCLVVALGAKTTYFGIEGMEKYSLPMKTLEDGMDVQHEVSEVLKGALKAGEGQKNIVIVGAGATGSETAAELMNFLRTCERKGVNICELIRVTLIDASPKVLGQFDSYISKTGSARLRKLGVEVRTDMAVSKVDARKIYSKNGAIPYDVLIWAGGVEPNKVTGDLPFEKDKRGRLLSGPTLQTKKYKDVFVIGDCAAFYVYGNERALPPTAWVAIDQGEVASDNIASFILGGELKEYMPPKKWPAVLTIGGKYGTGTAFGFKFSGYVAYVMRRLIDLRYFLKILPVCRALKFWMRGSIVLMKND